jgi:hypothetical protein
MAIDIFEVRLPGTYLDYPDNGWSGRILQFLRLLEDQLTDTIVALNLFKAEEARRNDKLRSRIQGQLSKEEREEDELRQELEKRCREELGEELFFQRFLAVQHYIEREVRRHRWETGQMPPDYESRILSIYAHAYVSALDSFHKVLAKLTAERDVPQPVKEALEKFNVVFPHLKGIRDSAHHLEDRGLGRDRDGNPLKLKPIDNGIVRAPGGGVLLLSVFQGNKLWYTLEDGSHGELAINRENIAIAVEVFQSVINAFQWAGRPRLIPSY